MERGQNARVTVASFFDPGSRPSIIKSPNKYVLHRGYEILHATETTREQRIRLLNALLALEMYEGAKEIDAR